MVTLVPKMVFCLQQCPVWTLGWSNKRIVGQLATGLAVAHDHNRDNAGGTKRSTQPGPHRNLVNLGGKWNSFGDGR